MKSAKDDIYEEARLFAFKGHWYTIEARASRGDNAGDFDLIFASLTIRFNESGENATMCVPHSGAAEELQSLLRKASDHLKAMQEEFAIDVW